MENRLRFLDRMAGLVVAAGLLLIAVFMVVLGVTLLPVIGILMAIPAVWLSTDFLIPERRSEGIESEVVSGCPGDGTCCAWPPLVPDGHGPREALRCTELHNPG